MALFNLTISNTISAFDLSDNVISFNPSYKHGWSVQNTPTNSVTKDYGPYWDEFSTSIVAILSADQINKITSAIYDAQDIFQPWTLNTDHPLFYPGFILTSQKVIFSNFQVQQAVVDFNILYYVLLEFKLVTNPTVEQDANFATEFVKIFNRAKRQNIDRISQSKTFPGGGFTIPVTSTKDYIFSADTLTTYQMYNVLSYFYTYRQTKLSSDIGNVYVSDLDIKTKANGYYDISFTVSKTQ